MWYASRASGLSYDFQIPKIDPPVSKIFTWTQSGSLGHFWHPKWPIGKTVIYEPMALIWLLKLEIQPTRRWHLSWTRVSPHWPFEAPVSLRGKYQTSAQLGPKGFQRAFGNHENRVTLLHRYMSLPVQFGSIGSFIFGSRGPEETLHTSKRSSNELENKFNVNPVDGWWTARHWISSADYVSNGVEKS